MSRQCLTGDLSLYVAYDGSDSNDGLSAATPFLTLQKSWEWSRDTLDRCGHSIIVTLKHDADLANTYAPLHAFGVILGEVVPEQTGTVAPGFQIIGNPNFHAQCHIHATGTGVNCVTSGYGAAVSVTGCKLTSAGQSALVCYSRGWITAGDNEFGACAWAHKHACGQNAAISQKDTIYWISGSAAFHDLAEDGGKIWNLGNTPTLVGTPAFSGAFVHANQCGRVDYTGTVFSGSASGKKFDVRSAGGVSVNGAASYVLPGNAAGVASTSGWYV
mgnify:CR=1 FL=1